MASSLSKSSRGEGAFGSTDKKPSPVPPPTQPTSSSSDPSPNHPTICSVDTIPSAIPSCSIKSATELKQCIGFCKENLIMKHKKQIFQHTVHFSAANKKEILEEGDAATITKSKQGKEKIPTQKMQFGDAAYCNIVFGDKSGLQCITNQFLCID
eukprot:1596004-Ditylum_brightwellii.AAC.1